MDRLAVRDEDTLKGKVEHPFNAKLVAKFAEGMHEGQREAALSHA